MEIKKKSGSSTNPDIHLSTVPSSGCLFIGFSKKLENVGIQWLEVGLNIDLVWYS